MTQQEFNQMLAVAIAGGLGGGTYISRWDGEQIDDGIDKLMLPGGIKTTELADGSVTMPKLAVEARPIRRNLLDNAYFIGGGSQQGGGQFPVNQRGKTEYTGVGYTIDRWSTNNPADKIELIDGRLKVSLKKGSAFFQPATLGDATYTLSFLFAADSVGVVHIWNNAFDITGGGLFSVTATRGSPSGGFYSVSDNAVIYPIAAKLEEGPDQTLAHKDANGNWVLNAPPPDYAMELARCRYYLRPINEFSKVWVGSPTQVEINLAIPRDMRGTPTFVSPQYAASWVNSGSDTNNPANIVCTRNDGCVAIITVSGLANQTTGAYGIGYIRAFWDAEL